MKTVWKFRVPHGGLTVRAHAAGKVVLVGVQEGLPHVWLEVDPEDQQNVVRTFRRVGTGTPVPTTWQPVGSWQEGPFVWHLYEEPAT